MGKITNIRICKLPYQEHPFVHGVRDGHDVWLTSDGQWTDDDSCWGGIPFEDSLLERLSDLDAMPSLAELVARGG